VNRGTRDAVRLCGELYAMRIRSEKVSGIIGVENWSRTEVDGATPD
jgi:hypothetical protein